MKKRSIFAALSIIALLVSATTSFAFARGLDDAPGRAPNQILVKFQPGTLEAAKGDIHRRHGGKVAEVIPGIDVQVITVPANKVEAMVRAYRGEKDILFAEPDYIAKAIFTPDDPYLGNQWGITQIKAPEAWDITQGSSAVKIAILDTGIDQNHEDLLGKIVTNKNCTSGRGASPTVDDNYGHGTHVAGIAAAITNNGKGVAGVGFNSHLMNVKVLGDTGSGYYSWVASGITWAANNGAKVINLSLGGYSPSLTLESAVNYAWSKGCIIVAAAGNDNTTVPLYPAYYTNCIAVAATDQNDGKASFSNYGSWVDIAAPGVGIFSTTPNHSFYLQRPPYNYKLNYDYMSGTSMATPHVAGVAALVWATEYGTGNADVRDRIESTADQAGTMWSAYGIKRVNVYNAVTPAGPPPPDTTGPITSGAVASPNPTAGAASVTLTATISDVTTGGANITGAEYFIGTIGDDGSGTPMSASDGAFDSPTEGVTATIDVSGLSVGDYTLYVHGMDAENNWGDTSSTVLNITEAPPPDTTGPITSGAVASPNPTAGAASVTLTATISDVTTGGANITGAEYFIGTIGDDGSGTPMSASDGAFDFPTEGVTATIDVSGLSVGDYTLYVHGQDANGYWGGTSSTVLSITEAPPGNANDIYVWSIDFRTIGTPLRISRLYIDITIKRDSNANGIAEATDEVVPNATVNIILTNQTTGQTWTGTGAVTASNGVATYYLIYPPRGTYVAEVTNLTHATYTWKKALDEENPSTPYILSVGISSSWSTEEILKFLEQ
jgi:thermitase